MCRNIRVLHNFAPPTTMEEVRDAALQYVRKVSGLNKPPLADADVFARAVDEITTATAHLINTLSIRGEARSREAEKAKARARWQARAERRP
jgi:hypothetical protein